MSDPKRILEGGGDLARSLLGAASKDAPSDGARDAARAALGIGGASSGGAPGGSKAGGALPKAAPALKSAAAVTSGAKIGGGTLALWAGVLALGGATAVVATSATAPEPAAHHAPAEVTAARVDRNAPSSPESSPRSADDGARANERPPSVVQTEPPIRLTSKRPSPARRSRPPGDDRSLEEETAIVDDAREALQGGRFGDALRALDLYTQRFAHGVLAPEAEALAIEATLAAGDVEGARSRRARFALEHPTSPLNQRIARLFDDVHGP